MIFNLPGTTTKSKIENERGISINGPYHLQTSKVILTAVGMS